MPAATAECPPPEPTILYSLDAQPNECSKFQQLAHAVDAIQKLHNL